MNLTEFLTMLIGTKMHNHNNHLITTIDNNMPDCAMCWLECNSIIHFIWGKDNDVTNTLPWFDCPDKSVLSNKSKLSFSMIQF